MFVPVELLILAEGGDLTAQWALRAYVCVLEDSLVFADGGDLIATFHLLFIVKNWVVLGPHQVQSSLATSECHSAVLLRSEYHCVVLGPHEVHFSLTSTGCHWVVLGPYSRWLVPGVTGLCWLVSGTTVLDWVLLRTQPPHSRWMAW